MATDIYCPLECKNRRPSGLCDLSVASFQPLSNLGAVQCEDWEEGNYDRGEEAIEDEQP